MLIALPPQNYHYNVVPCCESQAWSNFVSQLFGFFYSLSIQSVQRVLLPFSFHIHRNGYNDDDFDEWKCCMFFIFSVLSSVSNTLPKATVTVTSSNGAFAYRLLFARFSQT